MHSSKKTKPAPGTNATSKRRASNIALTRSSKITNLDDLCRSIAEKESNCNDVKLKEVLRSLFKICVGFNALQNKPFVEQLLGHQDLWLVFVELQKRVLNDDHLIALMTQLNYASTYISRSITDNKSKFVRALENGFQGNEELNRNLEDIGQALKLIKALDDPIKIKDSRIEELSKRLRASTAMINPLAGKQELFERHLQHLENLRLILFDFVKLLPVDDEASKLQSYSFLQTLIEKFQQINSVIDNELNPFINELAKLLDKLREDYLTNELNFNPASLTAANSPFSITKLSHGNTINLRVELKQSPTQYLVLRVLNRPTLTQQEALPLTDLEPQIAAHFVPIYYSRSLLPEFSEQTKHLYDQADTVKNTIELVAYMSHGDVLTYVNSLPFAKDTSISGLEKKANIIADFFVQLYNICNGLKDHDWWLIDIKPGNLLLNEELVLKIGDDKSKVQCTQTSIVALSGYSEDENIIKIHHVTPDYHAPELKAGTTQIQSHVVYTMGVTLYELIVGEFTCDHRGAPIFDFNHPFFTISDEGPDSICSRKLAEVVRLMLATDPDKRLSFDELGLYIEVINGLTHIAGRQQRAKTVQEELLRLASPRVTGSSEQAHDLATRMRAGSAKPSEIKAASTELRRRSGTANFYRVPRVGQQDDSTGTGSAANPADTNGEPRATNGVANRM